MRVILEPLIGDVPIVGAVTMFFIRRPVGSFAVTSICPFLVAPSTHIALNIMRPWIVLCAIQIIDSLSVLIDLLSVLPSYFSPRN